MPSDPLKDVYGGFSVGQKVQLQLSASAPRLSSLVVGMVAGRYIIIQRPETDKLSGFTDTFFYEAPLIVRYVHDGAVIGFRSQINHIIKQPDHLFFLQYPLSLNQFSLRASRRVDCFFTGEMKVKDETYEMAVIDLSREGCCIMASPDDASLLSNDDESECSLFFATREASQPYEFPSTIKRVVKDGQRIFIGLQFNALPDGLNEVIAKYIELVE